MTDLVIPQFELADRLRKALAVADVSVHEMADILMVSRNTVGNYINGRSVPKPVYLRRWAEVTGVPHEWLVGDSGQSEVHKPQSRCTERVPVAA